MDGHQRHWLPAPGECRVVDGSRITAHITPDGGVFYRIDPADARPTDFPQGRGIAAEAELARLVEDAAPEDEPAAPPYPSIVPPWRRPRRRLIPTVDGHGDVSVLAVGDRVRVGGREGTYLGRTLVGRFAVADGCPEPARRRAVRTYPPATPIETQPSKKD